MITPQDLAGWFNGHASYTYDRESVNYFGIDGEIDLVDLCEFIKDKFKEVTNA